MLTFMMESTYRDLATRTLSLLEQSGQYRVLILLIGAPGSGKSTIAQRVVDLLNEKHRNEGKFSDTRLTGGDLTHTNDDLPTYEPSTHIDVEDEKFTPTKQTDSTGSLIIRGRGGDDTALKLTPSTHTHDKENEFAQVVPMDGFHLPREILKQFADPHTAILRRGSPFTFDSSLVVRLVQNINETLQVPSQGLSPLDTAYTEIPEIHIPSFDHAEHDPKRFGTVIQPSTRVLIMEGLYLLLNNPVWCEIPRVLDPNVEIEELDPNDLDIKKSTTNDIRDIPVPVGKPYEFWKILIDDDKMLLRVGKRHLRAGIVDTLEEGEERVKVNDLPNGKKVYKESFKSNINIISIDDANET